MTATEANTVPGPAAGPQAAVLVEHVDVSFRVRGRDRLALRDVSFQIGRNESYGLVGESGSGKSTTALALTRYLPRNGRVSAGSIRIAGRDPLAMNPAQLRELRAREVSMVYQEPGKALNPAIQVGRQVAEVYEVAGKSRAESLELAEAMLRKVQISDPGRVMARYPHELSGGMAQRAVIAMAIAAEPSLLILDEPTTALDATVEAEVLDLIAGLRAELDTSLLFISHNLAVIAKMCDRIGVLYAGELIEEGPARQVFDKPKHPYTVGLLRCIPRQGQRKDHGRLDAIPGFLPPPGQAQTGCIFAPRCPIAEQRCWDAAPPAFDVGPGRNSRCYLHEATADLPRNTPADVQLPSVTETARPVVTMRNLSKTFSAGGEAVQAVVGVNLEIERGETLGLVGESGSGHSARCRICDRAGRHGARGWPRAAQPGPAQGTANRVPEPRFGPEPQAHGPSADQQAAAETGRPVRRRTGRAAGRPGQIGPDGTPAPAAAATPAIRRTQAASRHRPRLRRRPARGRL